MVAEVAYGFSDIKMRYPLFRSSILTFPNVSLKAVGKVFAPILDRITIWSVDFSVMTLGAWCMMAFTVSMPALTGGFERMQLNFSNFTGS